MELADNISAILIFTGILALLVIFYFWFYQQYRVDCVRQEIFAIRDDLFDYACAGNIPFDHPAYYNLRQLMNGMIRFSHRINLITLVVVTFLNMRNPKNGSFSENFTSSLSDLDPSVQEALNLYLYRMNKAVVKHLIKSSIVVAFITMIMVACLIIYKGLENFKQHIVERFPGISNIDNEAAIRGRVNSPIFPHSLKHRKA